MGKKKVEELLVDRLGENPLFIDYHIRGEGEIVDIKLDGSIGDIDHLPVSEVSEIFVEEMGGDYGLIFTENPPRGVPSKLSGDDEGVYVAVVSMPDDFIGYVYTYGAYFDIPIRDLAETVESLGDSATYNEFVQAMTDNHPVEKSSLESVLDSNYQGFDDSDKSEESAFNW